MSDRQITQETRESQRWGGSLWSFPRGDGGGTGSRGIPIDVFTDHSACLPSHTWNYNRPHPRTHTLCGRGASCLKIGIWHDKAGAIWDMRNHGLTCSFNEDKCMMQMDYWLLIRQRTTLQEEVKKLWIGLQSVFWLTGLWLVIMWISGLAVAWENVVYTLSYL